MLTLGEINQEMSDLDEWSLEGNSITKIYSFTDFKEALEFVNKLTGIAEKVQHHPDVMITQGDVRLSLTTHSAGGLTRKDFEFAREVDKI